MNEQEILQANIDIANFMGWVHHEDKDYDMHEMRNLKYHTSWDALIPVFDKIQTIEKHRWHFTIDPWSFTCIDYMNNEEEIIYLQFDSGIPLIERYYEAAISFIQWYNKQQGI